MSTVLIAIVSSGLRRTVLYGKSILAEPVTIASSVFKKNSIVWKNGLLQ